MYIKTIDGTTVDVFLNKGWGYWLRIQKCGKGIKVINGSFVPDDKVMDVLRNKIKWGK